MRCSCVFELRVIFRGLALGLRIRNQHTHGAPVRVEHGTVQAIQVYRQGDAQPVDVGTLIGGIAGGVIGHQVGGGQGRTVTTIGGAIAGAVIGHEIEKRRVEGSRYRITVRLDSGASLSVEEADDVNIRVGDRVRVENNRVSRE